MKSLIKYILPLVTLVSCSSSKIIPTTDVCSVVKHWKDSVFQVQINGDPISKHWYIYKDAVVVAKDLASNNKCMK